MGWERAWGGQRGGGSGIQLSRGMIPGILRVRIRGREKEPRRDRNGMNEEYPDQHQRLEVGSRVGHGRGEGIRSPPGSTAVSGLKVVELCFESFDGAVRHFEVLVESVAFLNELNRGDKYRTGCQLYKSFRRYTQRPKRV